MGQKALVEDCAGCHVTGMDLEKNTFVEPGVGCEACHGPGSWHAALPKTEVFDKRATIVNPAKLPMGVAVQICGSCHNRGKSLKKEGSEWAVGYVPGKALAACLKTPSFAEGDVSISMPTSSPLHHQQYVDWNHRSTPKKG